ncbi:hypothetical protein [Micromonospora sp. NPDC049033]|uniref:hypothetical protein n=1 Tax=Micromonospora sp. NPDC049033 TaxID=3155149 RepID=UPI0033E9C273
MDPNHPALRYFPLVARPRPAAKALDVRVDDLCALAGRANRENDLAAASAVYNQAALIASDCGQAELARQWCHEHADAHLRALPLGAQAARHALEPLVNLARLLIRDGNGDGALELLNHLFQAVSSRTDALIDGHPLPASRLTRSEDDHREVRQWLWSVLLADGTRALTSAGRWQEAYEHLQRHNGIGQRILDGRQVAVIARATAGDIEHARTMIADTTLDEAWEEAVTACLAFLCAHAAGETAEAYLDPLISSYRRLPSIPHLAVFHTRLGLAIIDAVGGVDHPSARRVAAGLVQQALKMNDAYVVRDLLRHAEVLTVIDPRYTAKLVESLRAHGPTDQGMPLATHRQLMQSLAISRAAIQNVGQPHRRSDAEIRLHEGAALC